jgi:Family of unknown function (DUF5689)
MSLNQDRGFLIIATSALVGVFACGTTKGITISAAKALPLGTPVTVDNVLISTTIDLIGHASFSTFQVQDATGGATVFGSNEQIAAALIGLSAGDQINLMGTTNSFNGMFEIVDPPLATSLVVAGAGIPAPIPTTTADFQDLSATAEGFEGKLVRLLNVNFTGLVPGETFAGATTYTVTDGTNNAIVRVQTPESSLVGDVIPTGQINLPGIFAHFDFAGPLPGVPGNDYELYLLDDSSIQAVPEPSTFSLFALALGSILSLCRVPS